MMANKETSMLTVDHIMSRKVLTVAADADVRDAAWGLTMRGIAGAPVKDDHGNLVGVLSKSDLLDPEKIDPASRMPHSVGDAMTPLFFAARTTDSVAFAVRRMVETGSHRIVVVDDKG